MEDLQFLEDKLSFSLRWMLRRGSAANPSPGEKVPPVRTLEAEVECGHKMSDAEAETDLMERNESAGLYRSRI